MADGAAKRNGVNETVLRWALAGFACCLVIALATPNSISRFYFYRQDLLLVGVGTAIGMLAFFHLPQAGRPLVLSGRLVAGLSAAVVAATYAGHRLLLGSYDLSRDEQMATFDARIFGSGRTVWPIAAQWRDLVEAFNTKFMPKLHEPTAWASDYLPGNAALRSSVGLLTDPALTGPLMTGAAVALTWLCARRLWPQDREPAAIATLMVALSGQVLITGMTAYAMPAHLTFNLLWLWLFLQARRGMDLACLAVGFVATGLHQPIFHPLFVAPWLMLLMIQRDWRRLALFIAGYGAIGLFWLAWPHWQVEAMGGAPTTGDGANLVAKLGKLLIENQTRLLVMPANLVRFVAWQPIALIPLCLFGVVAARGNRIAVALAVGLALTLLCAAVLMAFQGHGFGYRYLHGLIGNTALLAGFGWQTLGDAKPQARAWLRRSLVGGSVVLLPLQAVMAHQFYTPFAEASQHLSATPADFAIIGEQDAPYAIDLVFNQPDLSNRPLLLVAPDAATSAALAARLCRTPAVVALPTGKFYRGIDALFASGGSEDPDRRIAQFGPVLTTAGCTIKPIY